MRKDRPDRSGRAPLIETLSRHYLARGLTKHPDAGRHVDNVADIDGMELFALLKLAQKLGVDAGALIETTELQENATRRYSDEHPAFTGVIEFDLRWKC